jgi:hypothetical protein
MADVPGAVVGGVVVGGFAAGAVVVGGAVADAVDDAVVGGAFGAVDVGAEVAVGVAVPVGDAVGLGGFGGAVTVTLAAARGALDRHGALPVTVRLTDVTCDSLTGTASPAWSCRGAAPLSTWPRSHAAEPLPWTQPELKYGASPSTEVD